MKNVFLAALIAIGMIVMGSTVACNNDNDNNDPLRDDVVLVEDPTQECPPVVITVDYERKAVIETILSLKGWNQPIEWVITNEPIRIPHPNQNGSGYIEGFRINGADIPYSRTLLKKTQRILSKFSDYSVSEQKVLVEDLICREQLRMLDIELERAKCDDEPTLAPTPPVTPDGDDKGSGFSFPWWILWLLPAIALILFLLWLLSRLKRQDWPANESGSDRPNDDEEEGEEDPCKGCIGCDCKGKCPCCCCREGELSKRWSDTMFMLSDQKGSFSAEMQNGEFKISVSSSEKETREASRRKK